LRRCRGEPAPGWRPARWQRVSQVLTALTSVPESNELSGEARALAEFAPAAPWRGAGRAGHRGRVMAAPRYPARTGPGPR